LRNKQKESITEASQKLGIDRSHLSKLENGHERPSIDLLNRIINYYSLNSLEAVELSNLAFHEGKGLVVTNNNAKEVIKMDENVNISQNTQPEVQVSLNNNIPILYTDSVYATSNEFGLVLDFAQRMGPTNQQNIVARIGMSKEHAKALLNMLIKQLDQTETQGKTNKIVN